MTWGSDTLGAITVAVSLPEGVNGFPNSFQNRNVTIEATGSTIRTSTRSRQQRRQRQDRRQRDRQTFIRGSAFDAGGRFGVHPDSAILIGRSRNVQISGQHGGARPGDAGSRHDRRNLLTRIQFVLQTTG